MGGEWWFTFVKDAATPFNVKGYQARLLNIRDIYRHRMKTSQNITVTWSNFNQPNEQDANIFAKFAYICTRHLRHQNMASWTLYWDPTIVADADIRSNVHARCAQYEFIRSSFGVQKLLTTEFPKHFELYLGDGVSGVGEECDQYWGAAPKSHPIRNYNDGSWNRDYSSNSN